MISADDSAKIAAAKKIHERARYMRGRFLNSVAVLEREIALILTDYFCTSDELKREIFFEDVVTAQFFSLSARKDILIKIVKNDYPLYWDENSKVLKWLDEIIAFRNKLAHSVIDVSDSALSRPIEEGIRFIEWKDGKPITDAEFQHFDAKANTVMSCLNDIKRLLPFKQMKPVTNKDQIT